jgi:hypothetical protein
VQRVLSSNVLGYWTTTPITSSALATNVLALGPWNAATNLMNGIIPVGTTYFAGAVAGNQFGSRGAVQIVVNQYASVSLVQRALFLETSYGSAREAVASQGDLPAGARRSSGGGDY